MYYVTETQLKQILVAIKALPVRVDSFDVADAWVGLYLTVQNIASQHMREAAAETEDDKESNE